MGACPTPSSTALGMLPELCAVCRHVFVAPRCLAAGLARSVQLEKVRAFFLDFFYPMGRRLFLHSLSKIRYSLFKLKTMSRQSRHNIV